MAVLFSSNNVACLKDTFRVEIKGSLSTDDLPTNRQICLPGTQFQVYKDTFRVESKGSLSTYDLVTNRQFCSLGA